MPKYEKKSFYSENLKDTAENTKTWNECLC